MQPAFIAVESDHLLFIDRNDTRHQVRTPDQLDQLLDDNPGTILFSSSMDFPGEHTDSKGVRALIRRVRARCS